MNYSLTQTVANKIEAYEQELCALLQAPHSYEESPKIDVVQLYLDFVRLGFAKPYGRIVHLFHFLHCDPLMSDRMYPFCYLKPEILEAVKSLYFCCDWLINGLEEVELEGALSLRAEPHEVEGR